MFRAHSFGKTPDDFIGKSLSDFFPPEIAMNYLASVKHVADTCVSMSIERMINFKGERLWLKANLQPITNGDGQVTSVLIITRDTTTYKLTELRDQARLNLLQRLRQGRDVDDCLRLGCLAIFEAQLFKRAVLTLHNQDRLIINLGQIGLDEDDLESARKGSAPELELVKKMMDKSQHISHSYFVPFESGLTGKDWERRVPQVETVGEGPGAWVIGDELFVPLLGNENNIEGWLSVDTPFDGKRPSDDVVKYLEEIGVKFACNTTIGKTKTIEDLKAYPSAVQPDWVHLVHGVHDFFPGIGAEQVGELGGGVDGVRAAGIAEGTLFRVFPDKPVTKKPQETRMGKGKGAPDSWVMVVKPGRILYEMEGVPESEAREALRLAANKLSIKTRIVARGGEVD